MAHGVPGTWMPPTSLTMAIRDSVLRRLVAVQGQRERAADAPVVEGLLLVVHRHQQHAVPGALLHGDLRPQRLHQAVAVRRGEAAELDMRALAADGRHLGGGRRDEDARGSRRDRACPCPSSPGSSSRPSASPCTCSTNLKGPVPHHVLLVPAHVAGEDVGLVDPAIRRDARLTRKDASGHLSRKRTVWGSGASTASTARYVPLRIRDDARPAGR